MSLNEVAERQPRDVHAIVLHLTTATTYACFVALCLWVIGLLDAVVKQLNAVEFEPTGDLVFLVLLVFAFTAGGLIGSVLGFALQLGRAVEAVRPSPAQAADASIRPGAWADASTRPRSYGQDSTEV